MAKAREQPPEVATQEHSLSPQGVDKASLAAGRVGEEYLEGGVRRLALSGSQTTPATCKGRLRVPDHREPARVITMAWGDRYLSDLSEITIPALLAPGNLPALTQAFDCEFVIVTEARFFDQLARSKSIIALMQFADVRLVPIDDLLSPWYGITLTYALVRGFADLGTAMTNTHLIFLNADFVVADGSYRKLAEVIKAGERLVVSPSYCMDLEDTIDQLRARRDATTGALSLPNRELAELIIAHRHNTIRAKTVNQQMFRIHRYDQFYWYVDEQTLLARQMPIAVVYMRPQRVLTEMPTFWDYGVISEYCPSLRPCVLGDSDDFLMAELRAEGTFRELLHLGWPTVDEIAADLSSFTTQDHRDYGRYTLALHSSDLPADIEAHKQELAKFVDRVYARMSPPIGYRDHPFWAPQFPLFLVRHREELQKREATEAVKKKLLRADPEATARQQALDALRARILAIEGDMRLAEGRRADEQRSAEARLAHLDDAHRQRRLVLEREIGAVLAEHEADLQQLRQKLMDLEDERAALERGQLSAIGRFYVNAGCGEHAPESPVGLLADEESRRPAFGADDTGLPATDAALNEIAQPGPDQPSGADVPWHIRLYHRAFGRLPQTTRWHPYHAMLRPVIAALAAASSAAEILVISSGGPFGSLLTSPLPARRLSVAPRMLASEAYRQIFHDTPKFDLCFCELAADDLNDFRDLLQKIRPLMNKCGRIVMFHHNRAGQSLDGFTFEFTRGLFPLVGRSRIAFTGSYPGALANRLYVTNRTRYNLARATSNLAFIAILTVCAPLARLAARVEDRRNPLLFPAHCTSLTIEIELP